MPDAATGQARVVETESDKYWINLKDGFRVLKDGRILTTSERDGYRHIYIGSTMVSH